MTTRVDLEAGPSIFTVTAAPTANQPVGSLACRHGGGPGTTHYMKEGGTTSDWIPVAGVRTKAGTPADADFTLTPANGVMVIDTSTSKIWVRIGGAWKSSVALT